jgi:hypothetical protein
LQGGEEFDAFVDMPAFDAALDSVTLLYVDDTVGWIVVGGNSVTITYYKTRFAGWR